MKFSPIKLILAAATLMGFAAESRAVKVADITRINGQRTNVLTGFGLVVGLKGTGDGGQYMPAIRPLAVMLGKLGDPSAAVELNAANIALVTLNATVPADGVRSGDKIDVFVSSIGASPSLRGGRLATSIMVGPMGQLGPDGLPFALAEGPVVLEDPTTPTGGRVKAGAVMEQDVEAKYVDRGELTLVIEDPSASWTTASTIAKVINDAESTNGETIAVARDPKNVVITIPAMEREHPDSFISRVQRLPVPMLPTEARVLINERTGTVVWTGDVEISPVVFSQRGMTISTINPAPVPSARNPVVSSSDVVALDTAATGGAKLQELLNALDQLKVSAEDRINIVKELYRIGKLHAKLIVE